MTLISTITPCYKMGKYLGLFLEYLPKQTIFQDIEIVLDHNDPTIEELELVKQFQEKYPKKLKHIITSPVQPIGVSMNTCIENSTGNLLTIWNVDDLRTNNSLELQLKKINEGFDIAHGNFLIVNNFGSTKGRYIDHTKYSEKEYYRSMIFGPFFMFKKEILNKSGFFDEQLKSGADFDLAIRLALNGKIGVIDDILGYYLDEGKGASTNGDGRQPLERTVIELRYGINDKIEKNYLYNALTKYDIRYMHHKNKKIHISNFVDNYETFIRNNV